MKRREFVGAAAAAALLPAFLQKAFACPEGTAAPLCNDVPFGADDVTVAWRKAVVAGKPLLVIVVPADDGKKWDRGQLWGELINHGPTSAMAALGCVEVVCATAIAVKQVIPTAVATDDDLFLLVDTEALPATSTAFSAVVPDYEDSWRRGGDDWNKRLEKEAEVSEKRIAVMAAVVESAVFGSGAAGADARPLLARRVAQTEAARKTQPSDGDDDNASILVQRGELGRAQAAAERRLKSERVPGSRWANGGGCGVDIEGERDNVGIACGMGHTPAKARRFLYWFARD